MKRFLLFGVLLATWMFISAQSAMALGIDISATVNPNWNNSWNETELTGTALYTIGVYPSSEYGANRFDVTFEDDIFASIGKATDGTAGLISPLGWTMHWYEYGYEYEIAWGGSDVLEPEETQHVSFWVNYTLYSADQYSHSQASEPGWAWDEGGAWEQAVSAINTLETPFEPPYFGGNPSGGTSTVANPEPATLFLLGTGLIGLGAFGRKKFKKFKNLDI